MSRERCVSLDRAKRQQQNVFQSGGYMPERSPHRTPPRCGSPQYSPSTPDILRDSFTGALPAYSFDEFEICPTPKRVPRPQELQYEHALAAKGRQKVCSPPRVPQPEDLPDEYLEDFAQPSFYELPANSSFDEVMCALATPPSRLQAPAAHPLYPKAVENEVECQQIRDHTVNTKTASSPALCPYKIPPLPDDPYDIPPHPKDPTDVVGFIRRARAIHRLKAMQEAEAAKKLPKGRVKKVVRGAVTRKIPPVVVPKRPSGLVKLPTRKGVSQLQKPKGAVIKKKDGPSSPEHPPDYIAPEYAAAILRARQLAGLKTRNPKLLPTSKIAPPPQPRAAASPPRPVHIQPPATYASIVERAAAIRAKAKAATAKSFRQKDAEADVCAIMAGEYADEIDRHQVIKSSHHRGVIARKLEKRALERQAHAERRNVSLDEFLEFEKQTVADELEEELDRQPVAHCIADARGKDDALLPKNISLDEFLEFERQTAETPERETYAVSQPQIAAKQNNIADQIRLLSSAKPLSAAKAFLMTNRIKDLREKLCASGEGQLAAEVVPSKNELQTKLMDSSETPKYRKKTRARNIMRESLLQQNEVCASSRSAAQAPQDSPDFEMPPVIRFFDLIRRREAAIAAEPSTELDFEECKMPEYAADSKQFQDIADWKLEDISGNSDVCQSPLSKPPRAPPITMSPRSFPDNVCPSAFDDTLLDAIDIPISAFSTKEVLNFGEDIDLGNISKPEDGFDDNMTLNELGLEDITSPELDNLSISVLEGYDAETPFEFTDKSRDKGIEMLQDQQQSPGFLTTVVSAVVDKFRNMFGGTPKEGEDDENEPSYCINLDSTLPNMFATTPPPRPSPNAKDSTAFEEPFTMPKYPKEYIAMVKKSQLIYKQKAKEAAEAAKASKGIKKPVGRGKPGSQKKQEPPAKMYPPGEYSPNYAAAVARARTLAGYKNRSAILNPERAAKIAAIKAAKEAELAAEEALPPVERMRIARLQQKGSRLCPRPSVEALGTLEAIRANLPRPSIPLLPKAKWTPVTRRRADKSIEESNRVFTKSPIRVFEQFKPMTPLTEESYTEEDLIRFTPLRAREGRLRLKNLKELAARRDNDKLHRSRQKDSSTLELSCTPEVAPIKYSPIRLKSPSRPQSEDFRKLAKMSSQDENRGEESIREEVTKTSKIENGEVHTTTRKVTTKTDELGNVTCRIEEATGLTSEENAFADNIEAIEAPEFLNISDVEPPRDPSISSPSQIIDRIRKQVQQKLNLVLPEISPDIESTTHQRIEFPENLPDEQLYDIDIPELETTPLQLLPQPRERSPDMSLPYFWDDEQKQSSSQQPAFCPPIPVTEPSTIERPEHASPVPKTKSVEGPVVIPPCPKDRKDYVGMVLYARAVHKRKQQQAAEAAARTTPAVVVEKKPVRVPISRRMGKIPRKELLLKKNKKSEETKLIPELEEDDVEPPTAPPPLPTGYAEEVARAREMAGFKNRTAALNPKVAAEKEAEEAALAEFEALPEYQKILKRMEKVRRIPQEKRRIQPTADIIGTLEGIRANMPPIEASPICKTALPIPTTPNEMLEVKLMESKAVEQKFAEPSRCLSIDEFETIEKLYVTADIAETRQKHMPDPDISLGDYLELEREAAAAEELERHAARQLYAEKQIAEDEEFKALESEIYGETRPICTSNLSPNEFEFMDRKISAGYLQANMLDSEKPQSPAKKNHIVDQIRLLGSAKPQSVTEDYCMTKRFNELREQLLLSGESQLAAEVSLTPKAVKQKFAEPSRCLSIDQFEALEELVATPTIAETRQKHMPDPDISLGDYLELEREAAAAEELERHAARQLYAEKQIVEDEEFKALEREIYGETRPICSSNLSPNEFEFMDRKISAGYLQANMLDSGKPQSPAKKNHIVDQIRLLGSAKPQSVTEDYCMTKRFNELREKLLSSGESQLAAEVSLAQIVPTPNNQAFYEQLMEDFCPISKQFGREGEVAFGEFAPSNSLDPKERLRRIKESQQLPCPIREINTEEYTERITSPTVDYSPVRLFTTTGESLSAKTRDISPIQASCKSVLVDLETPRTDYRVKQFQDLEDMPFDELEFEDEPSFATTSFDKPLTPPPKPSELINRIRQQVQERLRNDKSLQDQMASISTFQFPQHLPEEDLFELSDPFLTQTTLGDTATQRASAALSPVRTPTTTATIQQEPDFVELPKALSPVKPVEEIYQHKYPKGYVEMVMKARALHKQKQQQQAEMTVAAPPSEPTKKKGRITTTKPGGKVVMKKGLVRPPKIIKRKEKQTLIQVDDERECPAEPPSLPPEYLADVARARQLAGYKNRTAALNPEVAARIAAYANLPEHEKIKVRMERLRKKSGHKQRAKPNMEQFAFIQAMKEAYANKTPSRDESFSTVKSFPARRLSTTPDRTRSEDMELAEFEALEEDISPHQPDDILNENLPQLSDVGYDQLKIKAAGQLQQFATPPQLDAHERYRRLLSQAQTHKTPVPPTPIQTPEIHFSPIRFASSPTTPKTAKRQEKSTTQITRSGDNTVKEQVIETSEMVNGQLQQVTKLVTTTTDPSGNESCQIKESRHFNGKEASTAEDELAEIEQPSFLDITPMSPKDVPRPRDIIERIRREVKMKPRPDVPTGQLIELRTPPRGLPLPIGITEDELFEMSCPALPKTPTMSPVQSPRRSPVRYQDVSIPELFAATPEPPTPPLPPVSPLRYRVHSPEGPIVIPSCPKDPTDYKGMVRMARKIYELNLQKEAAAEAAAIEALKPKKKERVPISRWTAPPPKKAATRKRLVMRKRAPIEKKLSTGGEVPECPSEPPPLPEGYAEEVARARQLPGLRNETAALNPKIAAREAVKAAALNAPPAPPADYASLMSKVVSMRKHSHMPKVQPSLQAEAYLNAVKGAMNARQPTGVVESPETRYKRILAARAFTPLPAPEECSMETTPLHDDVLYTPVPLGSPMADYGENVGFDILGLQDIGDLEEIQEPSFIDESLSQKPDTDRYIPPSPKTPPPTPSAIIQRIRKQVQTKLAAENLDFPMSPVTPSPLYWPEDLPEEELFELSAPSFARTPQSQSPTQIVTPNISIPRYFEATPQPKLPTPSSPSAKRTGTPSATTVREAPLMGVHPGLKVLTPDGPLVFPPHPKGPESVVDMIRRAQLIHKLKQKQEAAEAEAKVITRKGVRVPISRRPSRPTTRVTRKPLRPGMPKEMTRKTNEVQLAAECPDEPPELPSDYVAAVARARRLAGLKNTTALLNPPQDCGNIMARVAALKMARGEIEPTAQELAEAQNIIRRPKRKEVKEQQPQQTPEPAIERYRAYRSRVHSDTPTTSQIPYSPIKTPVLDHLPQYTPVCLAPTPPFYQNINVSDIGDISMPYNMDENEDTDIGDISMPFVMDDGQTETRDGQHEGTNLDNISMQFDVNESPYCRPEFGYVEPELKSFKPTESRNRAARRR